MVSTIGLALWLVATGCVAGYIAALRRNIAIARKTGFPYYVYRMP